jgi:SAM-dependent methyltransferase
MKPLDVLHNKFILHSRAARLAQLFSDLFPPNFTILDVGSGDGKIAALLLQQRPDLDIKGVDVTVRAKTSIPVIQFDGKTLPFDAAAFDAVMFVDVLHHTTDPLILLREAVRVAKKSVILKDHVVEGLLARMRLRFMDEVGNARHAVALPFNYWTVAQWLEAERLLGLTKAIEVRQLNLYPWLLDTVFGAGLHLIVRYDIHGPRSAETTVTVTASPPQETRR